MHAECPYDIVDFLINNLNYPITKLKSDTLVEIPVVVIFNVEDDGSISNVRVKEPVHPDFDKEAIRVVQKMEKWTPAMSNGRLVRSKFHVTIMFPNMQICQYWGLWIEEKTKILHLVKKKWFQNQNQMMTTMMI